MFIIRIWNYFRGYAIIIVEGLKIERFINLAVANGIYIWDIEKVSYTTVKAKIAINNFSRLRDIVKKTDSTVAIQDKRGFPFILKNVKKRKFLYTGLLLLVVLIYILSSYVWMIDIKGAKTIDKEIVLKNLNQLGLREGISKHKIDKHYMENQILIKMPDLTWVGINIKGTRAIVEVVEKNQVPELIDKNDACDIIATRSGVISKLLALNGDPMVKNGEAVRKGQVLVTGTILRENTEPRYVHSMAMISARTWYEDAEEMPLDQIEYQKTGREKRDYRLKLMGRELSKKKASPFKEYSEYVEEINILSFGDYIFPVKLIKTRYVELNTIARAINIQEAKQRCAERLNQRIKLQIPEDAVIVNKKIDYYVDKRTVKAKISVEVLEDIGIKRKIVK